jgi:hypothetical protein
MRVAKLLSLARIAEPIDPLKDGWAVLGELARFRWRDGRRVVADTKNLQEPFGTVGAALPFNRKPT